MSGWMESLTYMSVTKRDTTYHSPLCSLLSLVSACIGWVLSLQNSLCSSPDMEPRENQPNSLALW